MNPNHFPIHKNNTGVHENDTGVHENDKGVHENDKGVHENDKGVHENDKGVHENDTGVHEFKLCVTGDQESLNCVLQTPVPDSLGLSRFGVHYPGGRRDLHRDIERPVL